VKRRCRGAVDGVFPSRAQFPKRPRTLVEQIWLRPLKDV
jgi:hypothetical protein